MTNSPSTGFSLALICCALLATAITAHAQDLTMHHGQKVRINVLANHNDNPTPSSLTIQQAPQNGNATITSDHQILYQHTTGTPSSDQFSYQVNTQNGEVTHYLNIAFSNSLRIPNSNINVPLTPPATTIQLVNAFPGHTFTRPTAITSPPGDTKRLFICEKSRDIKVIHDVTAANPIVTTFIRLLNVRTDSESGVLGLAFHPNFASNRHFYVFYSSSVGGWKQRVSRFTANANDPYTANPNTELVLIDQIHPANNHNAGDLHFGPDGYLYIALGDGGGGNDQYNKSQKIDEDFFSGILRIDVDNKPGNIAPNPHAAIPTDNGTARYSIPIDNPFVHTSLGGTWNGSYNGSTINDLSKVRSEFFATGMRNPWRMSFDPQTGELWSGDVGQSGSSAREEINIVTKGGNYGWAFREGTGNGPKHSQAPAGFDNYHTPPIYAYTHGSGNFQGRSITGGIFYHGSNVSSLTGKYLFADYISGNIWSLQRNSSGPPTVKRIAGQAGIVAFGTDPSNKDALLADYTNNRILRITSSDITNSFPQTLGDTNLFADLSDLSPSPGLLPYQINLPFWSDHATKKRWFLMPDTNVRFGYNNDSPWSLPTGTLWVKHFDLEMERGNPNSAIRVETRVLMKNDQGTYGVSYRWNENQNEAFLVADAGETIEFNITDNNQTIPQTWNIPSRADCRSCHTTQGGHALSFNTRQLNLLGSIVNHTGNQLNLIHQHGFLDANPGNPNLLPRHLRPDESEFSIEARARSYLAVNCANCHTNDGPAPTNFDLRPDLLLAHTNLINAIVNNDGGNPANKLVIPGSPQHSVLLHRIAATNGFSRMPPIGTNTIDEAAVQLITNWIAGELNERESYSQWRLRIFGSSTSPIGEPDADPDKNGKTNYQEFLAGTNPLDSSSTFQPSITTNTNNLQLNFSLPTNRSFLIEISDNLFNWQPWNVPGNHGMPVAGGLIEIIQPIIDERLFFRIFIEEN